MNATYPVQPLPPTRCRKRRAGGVFLRPRAALLAALVAGGVGWGAATLLSRPPVQGGPAILSAPAPAIEAQAMPAAPLPGPARDVPRGARAPGPIISAPALGPAAVRALDADDDGRRPPRPETEAWYRKEARELALADADAFVEDAKRRFAARDAALAEKMGLAQAARDASPALAARVYAIALAPDAADPQLRLALVHYVMKKRMGDPGVPECLHEVVVRDRRSEEGLRSAAAKAVLAAASGESLRRIAAELERAGEPDLWHAALGGLARNDRPEARELLADLARPRGLDPETQRIASEGLSRRTAAAAAAAAAPADSDE